MTRTKGLLLIAALVAASCKANDKGATESKAEYVTAAPAPPNVGDVSGQLRAVPAPATGVAFGTSSAADTMSAPVTTDATMPSAAATAMIIRTGTATIKVDSLEPAVAQLRALALSVGGYVGNTSIQTGKEQLRSATVEIKVPSQRWGQLLVGLKPIGTLEAQDESAEDVGEEYVDVQARVANARRLEARLIDLLANRTGKLSDALSVERELARVREEIEYTLSLHDALPIYRKSVV